MTTRVNKKTWKRKSEVANKKDEENIVFETDEVNDRSLEDETTNKEYSQDKNKEAIGAHNNDIDNESPMVEQQEELSDDYLKNIPILF
jgi:hypothetical protein